MIRWWLSKWYRYTVTCTSLIEFSVVNKQSKFIWIGIES